MQIIASDLNAAMKIPAATTDKWLPAINKILSDFNMSDKREIAAFLATLIHESSGFTRLIENLNYSAQGLANTWPSRYSSTRKAGGAPTAKALSLHRKPEAIANHCYASRMGNGDEASGDGWRYRGHGPMMHTGKSAAVWLNNTIGKRYGINFVQDFDKLLDPTYGMAGAMQYWVDNVKPVLRTKTTASSTDQVYVDVASDVVNRGKHTPVVGDAIGYADRLKKFQAIRKALDTPRPNVAPSVPTAQRFDVDVNKLETKNSLVDWKK